MSDISNFNFNNAERGLQDLARGNRDNARLASDAFQNRNNFLDALDKMTSKNGLPSEFPALDLVNGAANTALGGKNGQNLLQGLKDTGNGIVDGNGTGIFNGLADAVHAAGDSRPVNMLANSLTGGTYGAINGALGADPGAFAGDVIKGLGKLGQAGVNADGSQALSALSDLATALPKNIAPELAKTLFEGADAAKGIASGIANLDGTQIANSAENFGSSFLSRLLNNGTVQSAEKLVDGGKNIVSGLVDGDASEIKGAMSEVTNGLQGIANGPVGDAVKSLIPSPIFDSVKGMLNSEGLGELSNGLDGIKNSLLAGNTDQIVQGLEQAGKGIGDLFVDGGSAALKGILPDVAIDGLKSVVSGDAANTIQRAANSLSNLPNAFENAVNTVENAGTGLMNTAGTLSNTFSSGLNTIENTVSNGANSLASGASGLFNSMQDGFSNTVNGLENQGSSLLNNVENGASGLVNTVENGFSGLANTVENGASSAANTVQNGLSGVINTVENGFSGAGGALQSGLSTVTSAFSNLFGSSDSAPAATTSNSYSSYDSGSSGFSGGDSGFSGGDSSGFSGGDGGGGGGD